MLTRKRSKPSSPFDRQKPQRNNNKPKKPPGPRSRYSLPNKAIEVWKMGDIVWITLLLLLGSSENL